MIFNLLMADAVDLLKGLPNKVFPFNKTSQ